MLPTSVVKEIRLDNANVILFIEVTGSCDEYEIVDRFARWVTEHAIESPPAKLWDKNTNLSRPLFIPTLISFCRGITGEFIFGIRCCFWSDCELNHTQRLLAVHRWIYHELNEQDSITIPKIIENKEFDTFFQEFGGKYKPKFTGTSNE